MREELRAALHDALMEDVKDHSSREILETVVLNDLQIIESAVDKFQEDLLERLREAESLIGSPTTMMFIDKIDPEHRLQWLRSVRTLLTKHQIEPENLPGRWHTAQGEKS